MPTGRRGAFARGGNATDHAKVPYSLRSFPRPWNANCMHEETTVTLVMQNTIQTYN